MSTTSATVSTEKKDLVYATLLAATGSSNRTRIPIREICQFTQMSPRAVAYALKELETDGLIARVRAPGHGTYTYIN